MMKSQLFQTVEEIADELFLLADYIYDQAECGCEEYNSQAALCRMLETHGFQVQKGVGSLPTTFRAVYKSMEGGPRIGLLCEYDALQGIGHACGHHMQGPGAVGAAIAVKNCLGGKMPFELIVYGCPDEEGYAFGGKIVMIEHGCFQDIDVALIMHGGTETTTDLRTLAAVKYTVKFTGKADPVISECAKRAQDAMLFAFEGVEFLREHILDDARIHYTYEMEASDSESFQAKFSVRAKTLPYFEEMKKRFLNIIDGAAKMAGAEAAITAGNQYNPKIPIQTLVDSFYENATPAGAKCIEGARKRVGSSDFANVMFLVPGIGIRIAFAPKGTSAHSKEWLALGKSRDAYDAVLAGAKTLAAMSFDLICEPEKIETARREFEEEMTLLNRPAVLS